MAWMEVWAAFVLPHIPSKLLCSCGSHPSHAVRRQVLGQLGPGAGSGFELCSAFPSTVLVDDRLTLQAAGLVPTATVHIKWT